MPGLANQLREGTKDAHRSAETTTFTKNFMKGIVSREDYTRLVSSYLHVYIALEEALEKHKAHPTLAALYFPDKLNRASAAAADVLFFTGSSALPPVTPRTAAYVARLKELSASAPELLLAHAYTRYLGDLSGGQMLAKRLSAALALTGTEGTAFYDFPNIGNIVMFKNEYRELLDSAPVDEATALRIVEEANRAFDLSAGLFADAAPEAAEVDKTERTEKTTFAPTATRASSGDADYGHAAKQTKTTTEGGASGAVFAVVGTLAVVAFAFATRLRR